MTVERDLQSIVATINKHNTSISAHARFAEMSAMSASGEEREATSSVVGHSSGARLWERMRGHAEHEAVEWPHSHISALAAAAAAADNLSLVVGSQLTTIRTDLSTLMRNLNLTVAQLSEAKAGAADTEMELLRVREVVEEEKVRVYRSIPDRVRMSDFMRWLFSTS